MAENAFIRRWAQEIVMGEHLLDFLLEGDTSFRKTTKRYSIGMQTYPAELEHPLGVLALLLKHGYALNEMELKCMKKYAFIEKVVKFPVKDWNLVEFLCKGKQSLS